MPEPQLEPYQPPQLGTSEGKYETLFENVHAAAFLTNFDGEILEANQRSCDLFGYSWEELVTMNLQKLLPPDCDWEEMQDEIASRGGINIEIFHLKKRCDTGLVFFMINSDFRLSYAKLG